ncbi:prepilin-type N-terminal cleavage/methylation domain-containing protein [Deltaproteobacteria bacterium TL4]
MNLKKKPLSFFRKKKLSNKKNGFSVLEVLVALSIMTVMLVAIYQSFATTVFMIASTNNLWRSMVYSQNELLRWERSVSVPVSVAQGEFEEDHELSGFRWQREISDIAPLPGITVRKVSYELNWDEGKNKYSYSAAIYVKPE